MLEVEVSGFTIGVQAIVKIGRAIINDFRKP
jgi:hypothetical protein